MPATFFGTARGRERAGARWLSRCVLPPWPFAARCASPNNAIGAPPRNVRAVLVTPGGPSLSPLAVGDAFHVKVLGWQFFRCCRLERLRRLEKTAIVILDLMSRDAQKPGPQRGRAAETVQDLPRSNEDFLNEILDEIETRRQPLADECVDGIRVRIYEFRRGLAIPLQDGGYQCNIVVDGTSVLSGWQRNAARLESTHCLDAPDGIKYSFRPGTRKSSSRSRPRNQVSPSAAGTRLCQAQPRVVA